jgi:uncharacterized 2Fe-2S/4Fe-4S cluster protein (DUF4445 family)
VYPSYLAVRPGALYFSFMSLTVTFLPSRKTGTVAEGTRLSDAASALGESDLHLECGGKGTCHKCLVELVEGCVEIKGRKFSVAQSAAPLKVLSCQSIMCGDAVVSINPDRAHEALTMSLGKDLMAINPDLVPGKQDISPIVTAHSLCVEPSTPENNFSDFQRLIKQLRKETGTDADIHCELAALKTLPETLRSQNGKITAYARDDNPGLTVVSVEPAGATQRSIGFACDIGTTTVSVHCVDMADGKILASRSDYNGQIRRGADVISRIEYAKNDKRREEMRTLVLATVNGLIDASLKEIKASPASVYNLALAGNTTMVHLLLGLPPQYIRESPYVPVVNAPRVMTAAETGLRGHPLAAVSFSPGVGSYVGGDITSGLLAAPMINDGKNVSLFMDIGTNGEIVIGNREFLVAAACSAGPAFEGSGIKCGMRAAAGAIESFDIGPRMQPVRYSVIGGGKPRGICGSGLISLLGELYSKGLIDRDGKISKQAPVSRVTKIEGTKGLVLVTSAGGHDGREIVITESDIENLIRTKGAIYAACDLMLSNIGLTFDSIAKVYIAGGFGRFINVEAAVRIGMLPDIPRDRFSYLGNSSLTGATLALLSKAHRERLKDLAKKMTYVDLSGDNRYMDAYVAALFLPHTDLDKFPSVK